MLVKYLFSIILTVLLVHTGFAADTPPVSPATGDWNVSSGTIPNFAPGAAQTQFGTQIVAALTAMQTAGAAMSGTLIPTGEKLLAILYAVTLAWYVYEGLAAQQLDMLFKKMISHTLIALIALEMLWGWTGSSGIGVANFLTAGMNTLGDQFTQGGDPADNIINAYYPAIESAIGIMYAGVVHIDDAMAAASNPISALVALGGAFALYSLSSVFALISAGLLAIAMIYSLFFANLGDFIIYVGLAVGPIFVATLVFPAAQGFFSKWLEFVISGGIYKLVAVVIGKLLAEILIRIDAGTATLIADNATFWTGGGSFVELIGMFSILIFWSLFAYFITKQIPHFVTALSGGVNIHLSSLRSLAPAPQGSFPAWSSTKSSSSKAAEIKAATAIRVAEIKAASAANTAAAKASGAVMVASIKTHGDVRKTLLRQGAAKAGKSRSPKPLSSESEQD